MLAKYRKIVLENGTHLRQFQGAVKSMRPCWSLIGVTVAQLDTNSDPHWTNSNRWLGSTKSMVVVNGPPYNMFRSLYGPLFVEGACGTMRKPLGIGSKVLAFSWMLALVRHQEL